MASTSETGHAKNIANFNALIKFVIDYGPKYNPSKSNLQLTKLQELKATADSYLNTVLDNKMNYSNAVNNRRESFSSINEYSTRIINALEATNATKDKVENAKFYIRKLQGKRAGSIKENSDSDKEAVKTKSTSQRSFDQIVQHFSGIVAVVKTESSYAPNENELKVSSLLEKQSDLIEKNDAVASANAVISNSRVDRDNLLYNEVDGLVIIGLEVKKYLKSIFGQNSNEYSKVSKIKFTDLIR